MRTRLLLVVLATGCTEHGSTPPDALLPDAKLFLDAPVTTCFSPAGSANVTVTPGSVFGRIYVGGVFGSGFVTKTAGFPVTLQLLITNAPEAGFAVLDTCTGFGTACTTEGVFVATKGQIDSDAPLGSHQATIARTVGGGGTVVEGNVTITEYLDPLDSLPGHITGTVAATTPTITLSGSFSSVFCPPYMRFPI